MGILLGFLCLASVGIGLKLSNKKSGWVKESEAAGRELWNFQMELLVKPYPHSSEDVAKLGRLTDEYLARRDEIDKKYPNHK